MLYHATDSRHTQNIQINKVIGENEKCVHYFTEKTKWTFWPIPCEKLSWGMPGSQVMCFLELFLRLRTAEGLTFIRQAEALWSDFRQGLAPVGRLGVRLWISPKSLWQSFPVDSEKDGAEQVNQGNRKIQLSEIFRLLPAQKAFQATQVSRVLLMLSW